MRSDSLRLLRSPDAVAGVVLALSTVGAYLAWLAWDQEYQRDPVTGATSGPYEAWQVAGCALTLGALAAVAGLRRRARLAVSVIPVVFTLVWSLPAAAEDETGLWVVGAALLLAGCSAGVAAASYCAEAAGRYRASRRAA